MRDIVLLIKRIKLLWKWAENSCGLCWEALAESRVSDWFLVLRESARFPQIFIVTDFCACENYPQKKTRKFSVMREYEIQDSWVKHNTAKATCSQFSILLFSVSVLQFLKRERVSLFSFTNTISIHQQFGRVKIYKHVRSRHVWIKPGFFI